MSEETEYEVIRCDCGSPVVLITSQPVKDGKYNFNHLKGYCPSCEAGFDLSLSGGYAPLMLTRLKDD